jgi:5'-nucleotidase
MRMKRLLLLSLLALMAFPAVALADGRGDDDDDDRGRDKRDVEVQLLGLNDFHGHLESTTPGTIAPDPSSPRVPAGGAEYLATHLREKERTNRRNTLIVSAGDLIGASPLLSALFHDEPTIEAMNKIGLDLNAVGNHEFDEGAAELQRMQRGGCHPIDGCLDGTGFGGAHFRFLAANVVNKRGRTIFPAYSIKKFDGIKVGFIGMTLEGTPDIVSPSGVAGLDFLDEADTANRYANELRRRHGVRAVVVLLHEGGVQSQPGGINDCNGISGPIVDIVNRTTSKVDLFVTGHTHTAYNCVIDGRPVTSASSFGRLLTDIDLVLDRRSKDVVEVSANNQIVTQNVFKAMDMTQLIERYTKIAGPLRDRVIGRISANITRTPDDSRENAAGNLIADAQLAATASPTTGSAVAAFMNPGGVRADFTFARSGAETVDGLVTYGEAFTVQPFGNSLVTMTLTGAQILEMLKSQWCGAASPRVLLPSASVGYTFDLSDAAAITGAACAGAVNPVSNLTIGGTPVDPAASYRITVNSFLADGGDSFPVLRSGTDRLGGAVDTDALEDYIEPSLEGAPIAPPALDRIDVIP